MENSHLLVTEAEGLLPETIRFRRDLHQHPELGLALPRTQEKIIEALAGLGLTISLGKSLSSVTAILATHRPVPTVLIRADMGALPMEEDPDLSSNGHVPGA